MDEPKYVSIRYIRQEVNGSSPKLGDFHRQVKEAFGENDSVIVSCLGIDRDVRVNVALLSAPQCVEKSVTGLALPGWGTSLRYHYRVENYELRFSNRALSDVAIELATSGAVINFSCTRDSSRGVKAFVTLSEKVQDSRLSFNRSRRLYGTKRSPTSSLIIASHPIGPALSMSCRRADFEEYCVSFSCVQFMVFRHISEQHVSFAIS